MCVCASVRTGLHKKLTFNRDDTSNYQRNPRQIPLLFVTPSILLLGDLAVFLGTITQWFKIIQQGLYLWYRVCHMSNKAKFLFQFGFIFFRGNQTFYRRTLSHKHYLPNSNLIQNPELMTDKNGCAKPCENAFEIVLAQHQQQIRKWDRRIVVKAILRSSRVIYPDNQCVKSVVILHRASSTEELAARAALALLLQPSKLSKSSSSVCFNALSRESSVEWWSSFYSSRA